MALKRKTRSFKKQQKYLTITQKRNRKSNTFIIRVVYGK